MQDLFVILTDTFHKPGFKLQVPRQRCSTPQYPSTHLTDLGTRPCASHHHVGEARSALSVATASACTGDHSDRRGGAVARVITQATIMMHLFHLVESDQLVSPLADGQQHPNKEFLRLHMAQLLGTY